MNQEPEILYWCCPRCGQIFWRTATAQANTFHQCADGQFYLIDYEYQPNENKTTERQDN